MSKFLKLLCLIPLLVGCKQPIQEEQEEQLIVFGIKTDNGKGEELPSEYMEKLSAVNGFDDIRTRRWEATPEELKGICTLYAHDWYLIDIVVYQGEPYAVHMENLPVSTSLAYYNNGEKEALYYSRDIGGRRNILQIGAFDFKTKKDVAVDIDYNELEKHHDYLGVALEFLTDSETGKKMLAARRIIWNDDDVMAIDYDSYLYEDLTIYPFADWEKFEAK